MAIVVPQFIHRSTTALILSEDGTSKNFYEVLTHGKHLR